MKNETLAKLSWNDNEKSFSGYLTTAEIVSLVEDLHVKTDKPNFWKYTKAKGAVNYNIKEYMWFYFNFQPGQLFNLNKEFVCPK